MKQRNLVTEIKHNYDFLTKAEKKIADYVLNNAREILFMSITDLAEACDVGETSVFRFCKTLQLQGYQQFKMLLSMSLEDPAQKKAQGSLKSSGGAKGKASSLLEQVYAVNVAALSETMAILSEKDLRKAADFLVNAKEIFFFGVGSSLFSALEAMSRFLRITPRVRCYEDSHMQSMAASMMTKEHVAVVISYSGSTKDSLICAQQAKSNGAKVVAITRHLKSPLTAYANVILQCGSNEDPMQGGAISTKISQLFIIDLLYTEYYARMPEDSKKNREKTSSSVLEKMI